MIKLTCKQCNKLFKIYPYQTGRTKFCSKKCYFSSEVNQSTRFIKNHTPWNKGIKREDIAQEKHYCWKGGLKTLLCKNCSIEFKIKPYRINIAKYCSIKCQLDFEIKNGLFRVGSKNHFWKGGITKLYDKIRTCAKYIEWRIAVFQKDNYTCQFCGERTGTHNADHIKPFAVILYENKIKTFKQALECKDLWDLSNGRTLCVDCHKQTPSYLNTKVIQQYATI